MLNFYRIVSFLVVFILPISFYSVFVAYVVESAKYYALIFLEDLDGANQYLQKANKLLSAIGYLTITCNFISCFAMVLVLRLVR